MSDFLYNKNEDDVNSVESFGFGSTFGASVDGDKHNSDQDDLLTAFQPSTHSVIDKQNDKLADSFVNIETSILSKNDTSVIDPFMENRNSGIVPNQEFVNNDGTDFDTNANNSMRYEDNIPYSDDLKGLNLSFSKTDGSISKTDHSSTIKSDRFNDNIHESNNEITTEMVAHTNLDILRSSLVGENMDSNDDILSASQALRKQQNESNYEKNLNTDDRLAGNDNIGKENENNDFLDSIEKDSFFAENNEEDDVRGVNKADVGKKDEVIGSGSDPSKSSQRNENSLHEQGESFCFESTPNLSGEKNNDGNVVDNHEIIESVFDSDFKSDVSKVSINQTNKLGINESRGGLNQTQDAFDSIEVSFVSDFKSDASKLSQKQDTRASSIKPKVTGDKVEDDFESVFDSDFKSDASRLSKSDQMKLGTQNVTKLDDDFDVSFNSIVKSEKSNTNIEFDSASASKTKSVKHDEILLSASNKMDSNVSFEVIESGFNSTAKSEGRIKDKVESSFDDVVVSGLNSTFKSRKSSGEDGVDEGSFEILESGFNSTVGSEGRNKDKVESGVEVLESGFNSTVGSEGRNKDKVESGVEVLESEFNSTIRSEKPSDVNDLISTVQSEKFSEYNVSNTQSVKVSEELISTVKSEKLSDSVDLISTVKSNKDYDYDIISTTKSNKVDEELVSTAKSDKFSTDVDFISTVKSEKDFESELLSTIKQEESVIRSDGDFDSLAQVGSDKAKKNLNNVSGTSYFDKTNNFTDDFESSTKSDRNNSHLSKSSKAFSDFEVDLDSTTKSISSRSKISTSRKHEILNNQVKDDHGSDFSSTKKSLGPEARSGFSTDFSVDLTQTSGAGRAKSKIDSFEADFEETKSKLSATNTRNDATHFSDDFDSATTRMSFASRTKTSFNSDFSVDLGEELKDRPPILSPRKSNNAISNSNDFESLSITASGNNEKRVSSKTNSDTAFAQDFESTVTGKSGVSRTKTSFDSDFSVDLGDGKTGEATTLSPSKSNVGYFASDFESVTSASVHRSPGKKETLGPGHKTSFSTDFESMEPVRSHQPVSGEKDNDGNKTYEHRKKQNGKVTIKYSPTHEGTLKIDKRLVSIEINESKRKRRRHHRSFQKKPSVPFDVNVSNISAPKSSFLHKTRPSIFRGKIDVTPKEEVAANYRDFITQQKNILSNVAQAISSSRQMRALKESKISNFNYTTTSDLI